MNMAKGTDAEKNVANLAAKYNVSRNTFASYAKEAATNSDNESNTISATEKKQEISQANKIDIEQIINQNTNDGQTEQITKKEEVLEYLTEYRTNKEIPKRFK